MWESQYGAARGIAFAVFDTTAMRAAMRGELKNYAALPDTARHGAELTPIQNEAQTLLLTLLQNPRADSAVLALKTRAFDVLGPKQEEGRYGGGMQLLGAPFGPMHPDLWVNGTGLDGGVPRRGRVTVVQYVDVHSCSCDGVYAVARRLKARFGDALDLLILTQTKGHYARRVGLDPAEESKLLGDYIVKTRRIPAMVGVYATKFVPNPAPDNRLVGQPIAELKGVRFNGQALIVDRRGMLVLAGVVDLSTWSERALVHLIESLAKAPERDPSS